VERKCPWVPLQQIESLRPPSTSGLCDRQKNMLKKSGEADYDFGSSCGCPKVRDTPRSRHTELIRTLRCHQSGRMPTFVPWEGQVVLAETCLLGGVSSRVTHREGPACLPFLMGTQGCLLTSLPIYSSLSGAQPSRQMTKKKGWLCSLL
jgi:hypothetical protein